MATAIIRGIAPSTVQNKGGFEATLNWVYRTGDHRTYYAAVNVTAAD